MGGGSGRADCASLRRAFFPAVTAGRETPPAKAFRCSGSADPFVARGRVLARSPCIRGPEDRPAPSFAGCFCRHRRRWNLGGRVLLAAPKDALAAAARLAILRSAAA